MEQLHASDCSDLLNRIAHKHAHKCCICSTIKYIAPEQQTFMMVKQKQQAFIMETCCASLEANTNRQQWLRCISILRFMCLCETASMQYFPWTYAWKFVRNSLIFYYTWTKSWRACSLSLSVPRSTGERGWVDMLFSRHSQGLSFIFFIELLSCCFEQYSRCLLHCILSAFY